MNVVRTGVMLLTACALAACATTPESYDYAQIMERPPRSILVLPVLNQTSSLEAAEVFLTSISAPLAEHGYYVFPVRVIEQLLRDNGMPTAGEMHEISLLAVREQTGADAVLYITIEEYANRYEIIMSRSIVRSHARLVATDDERLLWEGRGDCVTVNNGLSPDVGSMIVSALTAHAQNALMKYLHTVTACAQRALVMQSGTGLPYGPYHARYGELP
ncbi:MAG: DUF799 family lipoprotein [Gammaproteobacteria bacterium]|nr:DUF799 family lipoprotein [Gammaproteobacteria bacterium]